MSGANVASSQSQEAAIDNLSNVVLKTTEIKSSADLEAAINEKNRAFNDKDGDGVTLYHSIPQILSKDSRYVLVTASM